MKITFRHKLGSLSLYPDKLLVESPIRFLDGFMLRGFDWEIYYDEGDQAEKVEEWTSADMTLRIMRAIENGRVVRVMGWEYRATQTKRGRVRVADIVRVANEVREALKRMPEPLSYYCLLDDSNGVSIREKLGMPVAPQRDEATNN